MPLSPRPVYAVWEITLGCDLACKHCGSRAGRAREVELTTAQCMDVVHQMRDVGIQEVTLIGGEFYLRDDWDLIAAEFTKQGINVGMTTGARQLTDERLKRAEDAGVYGISVSIDGLEATHDLQRGVRGSWRRAVDAVERIGRTRITANVNSQINRLTMPELPALARLLAERSVHGWQIQHTVASGNGADRPELLLQPYDFLELFPLLAWIHQEILAPAGVGLYPGNNFGYYGPYPQLTANRVPWPGCLAGEHAIGVESNGAVKGCPSLPTGDYTAGFAPSTSIRSMLDTAPEMRVIRERTVEDLWGFCRDCVYAERCKGGCTWTSHSLFGKPGNNPYCIHRALELEAQGLREVLTLAEPAPGDPFDYGRYALTVEPLPDEQEATVLGIPLDAILAMRADATSAWSEAHRARVLRAVERG